MANIIFGLCAVLVGLFLIVDMAMKVNKYLRQRQFIDMEIGRTTGEEQKKWKRRRRRLWRIFLPRL
ncbi:MAG: hypothetical protein J6R33_02370 [Clostridia bacterium]|nr:hypothetical protein [Clostridia bacterium]